MYVFVFFAYISQAREAVFSRYAKQLNKKEWVEFAEVSLGLSCRDIKEVCEHTERRWVARILNGGDQNDVKLKKPNNNNNSMSGSTCPVKRLPDTPPLSEYLTCLNHRVGNHGIQKEKSTTYPTDVI